MADDSWDIEPLMRFDACDIPHGMKDYVLSDLTPDQQQNLNSRKTEQIRSDQTYLAEHPEIRGLIIMILRVLMKKRPKYDIYETIGHYFTKSSVDLKEEVYAYLQNRESILAVNSTIFKYRESVSEGTVSEVGSDLEEQECLDEKEIKKEEEKLVQEHYANVRWETDADELEKESVSSTAKICRNIMEHILENVIEEIDATSVGSIASVGFPVDYEDHAYGSEESFD